MPTNPRKVAELNGLRRAIYYAALSRGVDEDKAYRAASARCCEPTDGRRHTAGCEACWET